MEAVILGNVSGVHCILETGTVLSNRTQRIIGRHGIPKDLRIVVSILPDNPLVGELEAIVWSHNPRHPCSKFYEVVAFRHGIAHLRVCERFPVQGGRKVAFLVPSDGCRAGGIVSTRGLICSLPTPGNPDPAPQRREEDSSEDWFSIQS